MGERAVEDEQRESVDGRPGGHLRRRPVLRPHPACGHEHVERVREQYERRELRPGLGGFEAGEVAALRQGRAAEGGAVEARVLDREPDIAAPDRLGPANGLLPRVVERGEYAYGLGHRVGKRLLADDLHSLEEISLAGEVTVRGGG